jgi:pimeloyl-ACP methyl ester carboxylesterase
VRRFWSIVAAASLAAAGLVVAGSPQAVATPAAPATPDHPAGITWGTCADADLASLHAVCGYLAVPLDYAHPQGATIKLALSMIRHTVPAKQYQGVMLTNPGGPGGSGLTLSVLGQFVPNHAGDAYDWIGFDPRGVGSSKPAISCIPGYFHGDRPLYEPFTTQLRDTWLQRSMNYTAACARKNGPILQHLTTEDSARDMDRIRAALGANVINYYGFSYGTYLGQVYATLFPGRIRRAVLDSNVDPRYVWYVANLHQDVAFERNINIWFGWVAKYDSVYHLGTTDTAVRALWFKERRALAVHPAGGVVGPDEWSDIFLYAGYYQFLWTELGADFAAWVHDRDVKLIVSEFRSFDGPGNDNGFAVYNAVQCTDVQWPQQWSTWARDNWRTYRQAPFFTWGNVWYNAPCLSWPAAAHTPVHIDGSQVRPILLVDETLDAATPYPGSRYVRQLFPRSRLLAEPGGTTHAGTLFGNACVDDTIARYLATGALPTRKAGDRADAYCAPLPQPVPTAASSLAAAGSGSAAAQRGAAVRALRTALIGAAAA